VGTIKGRPDIAPCGHKGQVVVGTYVECLEGCNDAVPEDITPEDTQPIKVKASDFCPFCGSVDIELYAHMYMPSDTLHCITCGKLFT
jgi:hypothetical protein